MSAETLRQIDFAALLGCSRSYITKLKGDGRLIMIGDLVDIEASRLRIAETADPNRDDVASRWAEHRGREMGAPAIPALLPAEGAEEPEVRHKKAREADSATKSYVDARARNEEARADLSEMERDKARGLLIERAAVEIAVEDVMTTVRQMLEQQPHRVAPMLVGQDLDYIRATLKQETASVLGEMVRSFGKRLLVLAGGDETT